ncbi:MAG: C39 family peptidase [Candidatus Wildermuthbacteria bacterium]|nr:C39 family peptidase [Candidatus Wildermuthbacteria bacterium]
MTLGSRLKIFGFFGAGLLFFASSPFALDTIFSVFTPPGVMAVLSPQEANGEDILFRVQFDKPVQRKELETQISPVLYGEWRFEKPLIQNHLFRDAVFYAPAGLNEGGEYSVNLENIKGFGLEKTSSHSFAVRIPEENILASVSANSPPSLILLPIPVDWQDSPLSCEAASLKMALGYKGEKVKESDIMDRVGYSYPIARQGVVWGDPNQGFVGNIEGQMCTTGFGVFWDPLVFAAQQWRPSEIIKSGTLKDITKTIDSGDPIVVWGRLPVTQMTDCSWVTPQGVFVKAFKETHVRLVVGYIGSPDQPHTIILNDPLSGRLYWPAGKFMSNWEVYGRTGVIVH